MQDGTYLVKSNGDIVNYGERWGYGYFVANGADGVELDPGQDAAGWIRDATFTDYLVGVWTNPENGVVYIDPVDHVDSREYAIKLGRERGELAIWDAYENVAITL